MAIGVAELGLSVLVVLLAVYRYLTLNYDYWEARGVKGPKPIPLFGTTKDIILNKMCMGDYLHEIYKKWRSEPLVGIYLHRQPGLVVQDLDLVKDVLIKDFDKFVDRGNPMNEKVEPLTAHLFNIESTRWRPLRSKLSPTFTSGKLKEMFYLVVECADQLDKYLDEIARDAEGHSAVIEFNELTAKFTTDVIGVCAFGLQLNSIASAESPFRAMGRKVFRMDWPRFINFRLRNFAPGLHAIVGPLFADREMVDFFVNTTKRTVEFRKKNRVVKHDFIDLLMAIMDKPDKMADIEFTDTLFAAQLFVFFLAGFETSSSTMSNALYELAQNHQAQDKLREEIKNEMERTGGIIDYEGIKRFKYLDMVFQETLRMYPPVNILTRKSTEPYTFKNASGTKLLSIDKGQMIWIPIYGIQRDPRYFPNPDVFDPHRFTPEAIKSRPSMSYLPFGEGPRNCIGKRFGVMQTKVGLVKILHRHRVDVCERTQIPFVSDPKGFLLLAKDGVHLRITRDTKSSTDLWGSSGSASISRSHRVFTSSRPSRPVPRRCRFTVARGHTKCIGGLVALPTHE